MWRRALVVAFLLLISSVFVAEPALAQNTTWSAQYYNNSSLSGNPAFTRNDANIAFDWGVNSPGSGVDSDHFSVRWATDVALAPGTYRFYALADDNIRVIFNFGYNHVIDTFSSGQVNQLTTGDVTVSQAGTYHIQVDYREVTDQAFAYVSYANLATNPTGPSFSAPVPVTSVPVTQNAWTAQYYGNSGLLGDPIAITTESSPSHNWGTGSPIGSVPVDNFSARWTSMQYLSGGTYSINARADDGVRVYVNGALVINEWHGASGQTYSVSLSLPAGQNYFQVEYYENTGNAFLDFSINQTAGGGGVVVPTSTPQPSGALATVTAYRLNVRNAPDPVNGQIITRINRLETYPIVGRTADSYWYLLNIGGAQGWVAGGFINVANGFNIPVVTSQATDQPTTSATGNVVTATPYNVVIRSGPGTQYNRLGLLPVTGTASVIGRNVSNTWWQIDFNGIVGWVSSQYAVISSSSNVSIIPVTG